MRWKSRTLTTIAVALAVGAGAVGAALATTGAASPKAAATAFIHDVATRLGVSDAKLTTALKDASVARVDLALKNGEITKAQADALKARIQAGDTPLLLGPGRLGGHMGGGFGHMGPRADVLAAAATYLGRTETELRADLAAGKSLATIAKEAGKTTDGLKAALTAAVQKELDEHVTAGDLTADQAKLMLERFTSHVDDMIAGTRPEGMPGGGHGFGGMSGPGGMGGMGMHGSGGMGMGGAGASFAPAAGRPA